MLISNFVRAESSSDLVRALTSRQNYANTTWTLFLSEETAYIDISENGSHHIHQDTMIQELDQDDGTYGNRHE